MQKTIVQRKSAATAVFHTHTASDSVVPASSAPTTVRTTNPVVPLFSGPPIVASVDETFAPAAPVSEFPALERTVFPVSRVPNWGAMTGPNGPEGWNRTYAELDADDFVPVPSYDLQKLVVPLDALINPRNIDEITRKLTYSTRYFSAYDIDTGEFTGAHAGIDLKLALNTPIGSIAGGRVQTVAQNGTLGLHVIVEHRHPTDGTFFSVYAHFGSTAVSEGQNVAPGQLLGTVGMTGNTSGPHLHLAVDKAFGSGTHAPYAPSSIPSAAEAAERSVNPVRFIQKYANGI